MKILFLATYFPRPLNPTIGTWALEQAKALKRNAESGNCALDSGHSALAAPSGALRVVSGNPSVGSDDMKAFCSLVLRSF
jgi:hypothetical protein